MIQDEWARNLTKKMPGSDPRKMVRINKLMNVAIPDALIPQHSFEGLISKYRLPDPDDRHVMAAAVAGKVEGIVTLNIRDFPAAVLKPHGVRAIHPDELVLLLCSVSVEKVVAALTAQASMLTNPQRSGADVLASLKKAGLSGTADLLSRFL